VKYFFPNILIACLAFSFVAHADDFYVSCLNDNTIVKISGENCSTFASEKTPFWGIAVDRAGNLYVSSLGTNSILKYTSADGTLSGIPTVFAKGLHSPLALAFDRQGNLYESEVSGDINKFVSSGAGLSSQPVLFVDGSTDHANLQGSRQADAMAFDQHGNLYIAIEIGGILKFTNTPSGLSHLPDDKPFSTVSRAREMAFDPNGNLFTANHLSGENYVYEYPNTDSGLSSTPSIFAQGTELNGPYGVTFDSQGNLYVTNWGYYNGTEILEYPRTMGVLSSKPVIYGSGFNSPVIMVAVRSWQ
jgi:hypothetical protein